MTIDWNTFVTDNHYGTSSPGQSHSIDRIYQGLLDRNADPGGRQYWEDAASADIAAGGDGSKVYQSLVDTIIKYDPHYAASETYKAANPDWTSADLKKLSTAYVSPFHTGSGSAYANWKPGDKETATMAAAGATTDAAGNVKKPYSDHVNTDVGDVLNHIKTTSGVDLTGTGVISGGVQSGANVLKLLGLAGGDNTVTGGDNTVTGDKKTVTGLTKAEILALIAKHGGGASTTTNNTTTGGGGFDMNSFMQMMLMMNMMGGSRGGSQYGYGGLNPGGVSPAFDYKDMATWMKDTFGSSSGGATTNTVNTGTI